jgi:CubicO group peptidase (beta-lactamase class C family)
MTSVDAVRPACESLLDHAEQLTRYAPVPGGVVLVADGQGTLAHGAFGYANLERGTRMTTGHSFEIGSISKVFTGILVNQLIDQGRLSLATRVQEVLPWVRLGAHGHEITIRHLLNHTAGLIAGVDALTDDLDQVWVLRDLPTMAPGRAFHYSNAGFVVLGLVIAELSGQPFPSVMQSRVLDPLGMSQAIPSVTHADRDRLATGYQPAVEDRPWLPGDPLAPAPWFEVAAADGNIAATASDMARMVALLLGDSDDAAARVLSPAARSRMTEALAPGGEPVLDPPGCSRVESSRYGLGINVEVIDGHDCLSHGGGMVGYSTFLLVDRTAGFGTVVLTNANGDCSTAQHLARSVHARIIGSDTGADVAFPPADPRVVVSGDDAASSPPVPLGHFGITPGRARDGELLVDRDPVDGHVRVTADGVTASLFRAGPDRYVTDHPGLRLFHLDPMRLGEAPHWVHGPDTYVPDKYEPAGSATLTERVDPLWHALVGHYRSYSPWYPHLRVYVRAGRLWLAAPGGVEAPSEVEELVPITDGVFRIGADATGPEQLRAGPIVEGRAVSVERAGCRYSRSFTD